MYSHGILSIVFSKVASPDFARLIDLEQTAEGTLATTAALAPIYIQTGNSTDFNLADGALFEQESSARRITGSLNTLRTWRFCTANNTKRDAVRSRMSQPLPAFR
jgi:hypothetical protein